MIPEEPVIDPVYANDRVVGQYPAPGSVIYDWENITIFFYDPAELAYLENVKTVSKVATGEIREKKTVEIEYPSDIAKTGEVPYIKIEIKMAGGEKKTQYKPNLRLEDFPLVIDVPFSYGSDTTIVDIYLQDSDNREILYKRIYVYD